MVDNFDKEELDELRAMIRAELGAAGPAKDKVVVGEPGVAPGTKSVLPSRVRAGKGITEDEIKLLLERGGVITGGGPEYDPNTQAQMKPGTPKKARPRDRIIVTPEVTAAPGRAREYKKPAIDIAAIEAAAKRRVTQFPMEAAYALAPKQAALASAAQSAATRFGAGVGVAALVALVIEELTRSLVSAQGNILASRVAALGSNEQEKQARLQGTGIAGGASILGQYFKASAVATKQFAIGAPGDTWRALFENLAETGKYVTPIIGQLLPDGAIDINMLGADRMCRNRMRNIETWKNLPAVHPAQSSALDLMRNTWTSTQERFYKSMPLQGG